MLSTVMAVNLHSIIQLSSPSKGDNFVSVLPHGGDGPSLFSLAYLPISFL